jgi:VanZ family protein
LWCVFIAAAYSLTDEFHQMFVPGRHASLMDCGVDTTGAAIAVAIVCQGQRWFRRMRRGGVERGPGSGAGWNVRGRHGIVP